MFSAHINFTITPCGISLIVIFPCLDKKNENFKIENGKYQNNIRGKSKFALVF